MLKFVLLIIIMVACNSQTFSLNVSSPRLNPFQKSHLQQQAITKPLRSSRAVFTLSLIVSNIVYDLTVDTGSSDFFIKGEKMVGLPAIKYNCSSCMRDFPKTTISYLDGDVSVYAITANVTLTNTISFLQSVLVGYSATTRSFDYMGGILGLSLKNTATGQTSFLQTLRKSNIIQKKIFAVKLNFKKQGQSFITFGSIDPRFLAPGAVMRYHRLNNSTGGYTLVLGGAFVGDYALTVDRALLDTGNTCITFPDIYMNELLDVFNTGGNKCTFELQPGNQRFRILLCKISDFYALPVLKIVIEDTLYTIGQEYYIQKCQRPRNLTDRALYSHSCQTLVEIVTGFDYMFLGATFFLKYYGVFDLQQNLFGVARNNDISSLAEVTRIGLE